MTVRRFAERRGWALDRIEARLQAETVAGKFETIDVELVMEGDLDDERRTRLREVASKCTIGKTLAAGVSVALR